MVIELIDEWEEVLLVFLRVDASLFLLLEVTWALLRACKHACKHPPRRSPAQKSPGIDVFEVIDRDPLLPHRVIRSLGLVRENDSLLIVLLRPQTELFRGKRDAGGLVTRREIDPAWPDRSLISF